MNRKVLMRYPNYYEKFKCTALACEDNCCRGWRIFIDKDTYDMYSHMKSDKERCFFQDNIKLIKNNFETDAEYAEIKFDNDGKCPFLSKENLCSIVTNYGENYISNVCRNYPRIINKIDGKYEISLDLSCIEAAKIVLLNKNKVIIKSGNIPIRKIFPINDINFSEEDMKLSNYYYMKNIRDKSIKILQNNRYTLSENLYIEGLFIESLRREMFYNRKNSNDFIEKYNYCRDLDKDFNNFNNYIMQIAFYNLILKNEKISSIIDNGNLKKYMKRVINGFRLDNRSVAENKYYYMKVYEFTYKNIMMKYEYIFKNYIINYIFSQLYPFDFNDVIFDGYIMLLFRIGFLRFICTGMSLYYGFISEDVIVKIIQVFTKEFDHNSKFVKAIIIFIKDNEFDNRNFVEIMIT